VDIIGSGAEKWRPASRETADHSLPFIVAVALADGELTERQFAPERFSDRRLLDLVQRVKVERHRELSAAYPDAVANIVTVRLRDGRTLTERVDYPKGHAKNPLTDAEVEEKFLRHAEALLQRDAVESLLHKLWRLDEIADVGDIVSRLKVRP
jgi:2-methylcitrate dehydratase